MAAAAEIGLAMEPVRMSVAVVAGTSFPRPAVPNACEQTMPSAVGIATGMAETCCWRMKVATSWSTCARRSAGAVWAHVPNAVSKRMREERFGFPI